MEVISLLKDLGLKTKKPNLNDWKKVVKAYEEDILHWKDYDYILINENLENCYKQIEIGRAHV